jgi:hypothetical protein
MIGDQFMVMAHDHSEEEMVIVNTTNHNVAIVPLVHIKMITTVLRELTVEMDYDTIDEEF